MNRDARRMRMSTTPSVQGICTPTGVRPTAVVLGWTWVACVFPGYLMHIIYDVNSTLERRGHLRLVSQRDKVHGSVDVRVHPRFLWDQYPMHKHCYNRAHTAMNRNVKWAVRIDLKWAYEIIYPSYGLTR